MPATYATTPKVLAGLLLLGLLLFLPGQGQAAENGSGDTLPVKDTVTMVDLGADNCLPCRMMTPIIAELKKTYQGKAAIVFVDVYRENALARKFHPLVTPTQVFFDQHGKEVSRHQGFMEKAEIVKELDRLLAGKR